MNNQAAQTMPLPPSLPEWSRMDDLGGVVPSEVRQALIAMYQQGYAAALSQTAGVTVDADEVLVPWDECYSIDGDSWCDSPADAGFVDGLKVGDTYDLIVSHWSITRTYVVTKAPDETSDDYEVEPVSAASGEKGVG